MANNIIPGAGLLGFGFNVLGTYDVASALSSLFAPQAVATQWTDPATGIVYDVPKNVSVINDSQTSGAAYTFTDRRQFAEHFASSVHANISAGGGMFSGEFDAAYATSENDAFQHFYGSYEMNYRAWTVALSEEGHAELAASFLNDPDVQALPTTFSTANAYLFFTVFAKYGTHFIHQATVGGRLYYYIEVDSSYESDMATFSANISLEYKSVFTDASAQAAVDWSTLGQEWASHRTVRIAADGGDTSTLNGMNPTFGSSFSPSFTAWQSGVQKEPAAIDFQLRPLSVLFSGDQSRAIDEAIAAYVNNVVYGYAQYDWNNNTNVLTMTAQTILLGNRSYNPVPPPPPPANPNSWIGWAPSGYNLLVVDNQTLQPLLNKIYWCDNSMNQTVYDRMFADVSAITAQNYIVCLVGSGINYLWIPMGNFYQWLQGVGASLASWDLQASDYSGLVNYICVGQNGLMPGSAVEVFWSGDDHAQTDPAFALPVTCSAVPVLSPNTDGSYSLPASTNDAEVAAAPELAVPELNVIIETEVVILAPARLVEPTV